MALQFALRITDGAVSGMLPSLYLNIGKCHEDLGELEKACALSKRVGSRFGPAA